MSPETGRRYRLTMICEVWRVARSSVYLARDRAVSEAPEPQKRGQKTKLSDEGLVEKIREVLAQSDFLGEATVRYGSGSGPRGSGSARTGS